MLNGLVDERGELLHGGHAIGDVGNALLHGVDILAGLGENIGVLRGREDTVEGGLEEALAGTEEGACCLGGGERHLVRGDSHDGTIFLVELDVVEVGLTFCGRYEDPESGEGGEERAGIFPEWCGVAFVEDAEGYEAN